jgi:hypothetical protein
MFFFQGRGTSPKVYVVAVWTKPNARSGGRPGVRQDFGIFLLPVFLEAALSLAHRRVLRIGFCFVVLLLFNVEVLVEGMSLSLIGIERDGKSTRLPNTC